MAAYYKTHTEEYAARDAAWRKANPEVGRVKSARRRIKVKISMSSLDLALSVDYRRAIANDPCFYCGAPGEHDDHYVSLANGGTDHWWNLVRACQWCNLSKGPKNGDEFIAFLSSAQ